MTQEIQWGPAIAVDGKRPASISLPARKWQYNCADYNSWATGKYDGAHGYMWGDISHIRLPADHPHYRQTAAAGTRFSDFHVTYGTKTFRMMDLSLDPDLVEARECVAAVYEKSGRADLAAQTREGFQDKRLRVQSALLAIKRAQPTPQADTKPDLTALLEEAQQRLDDLTQSHDALRARLGMPPRNVDPALREARKLAAVWSKLDDVSHADYLNGRLDSSAEVQLALAAFEGGRALALAGEKEA